MCIFGHFPVNFGPKNDQKCILNSGRTKPPDIFYMHSQMFNSLPRKSLQTCVFGVKILVQGRGEEVGLAGWKGKSLSLIFSLCMQLLMIHNICSIFSCWLHRLLREPLVMKGKMLVLASDKVETMTISFKPNSTLFCLRPFSSPPTTTSEGQDASVLKLLPALAHQHFVCQEESFSCKKNAHK